MNARSTIKKLALVALWLCIGGGMLTLLIAAIGKKNKGTCQSYVISFQSSRPAVFIDRKDVEDILIRVCGNVKGQPVASINIERLEEQMESSTWISDAEVYFDSKEVLHISVKERAPVGRVFTVGGNSFYVDSAAHVLPLSDKKSARVPVFTGFPSKKQLSSKDSFLLKEISVMANFISRDEFWNAQVSQIDILPDRSFEMIPLIGDHVVKLGSGSEPEAKFRRLRIFYEQVLSKTGVSRYRMIDVQFKGQVLVSQQGGTRTDSVQLRKSVDRLIRRSNESRDRQVAEETDSTVRKVPKALMPAKTMTDIHKPDPEN